MHFHNLSYVLDELLERSDLLLGEIDQSLQQLAATGQPTTLKPGHPCLRQVHDRTGINLVGISRRYRRLLAEIEQVENGALKWRYREQSRTECLFMCRGVIPHAVGIALISQPLRRLIVPTGPLGEATIESLIHDPDGWLELTVAPQWRRI
ncbi:MAG: hypothetical protein ABI240_08870 [Sphingomonas sp.]